MAFVSALAPLMMLENYHLEIRELAIDCSYVLSALQRRLTRTKANRVRGIRTTNSENISTTRARP
ncbi:hypothetical protein PILCRDRAFT_14807 [Piloderma croceum F 1598]|uniref:Uncharacterized protein n=1 Tax=Piloderma croceum (strain F 1598) TaxID=765440 RepID=A0A0C3AJG8_PILCF|nr:hypothetical protein PILCRDRAFT_14807 [Piloderma croceum F 1598]